MLTLNITDNLAVEEPKSPCVIALGNFDGVHTGHTALLSKTVSLARELGVTAAVFTFAKHPETVLKERNTPSITTPDEKLVLLEKLEVDKVYLADFEKIRNYSPERFVNEILLEKICAITAVCGYDFKFGSHGAGTPDDLTALMDGRAVVIPPVIKRDKPVSSTLIRQAIECGDAEYAAEMLGRPFSIKFPVVHGKELGRTIGVPTINQYFPEGHVIPEKGVYACKVKIGDSEYVGATNVGIRPTVEDNLSINCETHIVGFSGSLYGECIEVDFYKKLRDETSFDTIEKLVSRINKDISEAVKFFNNRK